MADSILTVIEQDGSLVVDSRLIAERLGVQHETFMKTIRKYRERIESRFGHLRFEVGTVTNTVGAVNETTYVLLTEPQATVLMTYSRNTDQVLDCKDALVEAFEKAKQIIRTNPVATIPALPSTEQRLANLQQAKFLLEELGTLDDRDRLWISDHVRNAFDTGNKLLGASQFVTISNRAVELGYKLTSSEEKSAGIAASNLYKTKHGSRPTKHKQFTDGASRDVCNYTVADLDVVDAAIRQTIAKRLRLA